MSLRFPTLPTGTLVAVAAERNPGSGRDETEQERVDRNLQEMLGELRVALPGVQVLFAFLLVVPFNQRFGEVTSFQKAIYFVTLMSTTASAICLIAPSVHHRIEFRRQHKDADRRDRQPHRDRRARAAGGRHDRRRPVHHRRALQRGHDRRSSPASVALAFSLLWFVLPLRRLAARRR